MGEAITAGTRSHWPGRSAARVMTSPDWTAENPGTATML